MLGRMERSHFLEKRMCSNLELLTLLISRLLNQRFAFILVTVKM